jgi:hypothetical protein
VPGVRTSARPQRRRRHREHALHRLVLQLPRARLVLPDQSGAVVAHQRDPDGTAAQGTLVVGVHASFIDTRLSAEVDAPKHTPADVAALVLAAVEADEEEVLVDERTRAIKAAIPRDLELIYPDIEAHWKASQAFRTVHPIGWAIWKGEIFAPSEEELLNLH